MSILKIMCCAAGFFWVISAPAATIVVNTTDLTVNSATDGLCNLKEAVDAANSNLASGNVAGECAAGEFHPVMDVIEFDVAILPAYFATFEAFTLTESVHIKGTASELVTFGGIAFNRAFVVANSVSNAQFIISDVTFAQLAIILPFDSYGGAVLGAHANDANLTIERVHFIGNNAEQGGGAIGLISASASDNTTVIKDCLFSGNFVRLTHEIVSSGGGGGAIFIGGNQNVTIENSTFVNNSVTNIFGEPPLAEVAGGAILVRATGSAFTSVLTISQSTFSKNTADGVGGALAMGGPGYPTESSEVSIKHSTFIANTADFNNNQTGNDGGGGGIYSSSNLDINLLNNIIAGNSDLSQNSKPEVSGVITSGGYNLIGNNLNATFFFPTGQPNINNDFVGAAPQIILPFVAPLADNGGPTPTYRLLPGSTAIDQGKCNALTSDQRHHQNGQTGKRTIDQPGVNNFLSGCDIGAYELGSVSENPFPTAIDDVYTLLEGESLLVSATNGLLANDQDNDDLVVISAGNFLSSASTAEGPVDLFADGSFGFQTNDPDANGVTTFSYTISDLYNHAAGSVELSITAVNDKPGLTASTSPIFAIPGEDTNVNWGSNITTGADNESNQSLTFLVDISAVPNGFFNVIPSVNVTTGVMNFEIAENATGSTEIFVSLKDNGGTANGGEDTAGPFTQIIHVNDIIFIDGFE